MFIQKGLQDIDLRTFTANTIFFPKSIGEFEESQFRSFLEIIENGTFSSDKMVIVSSARAEYMSLDVPRFQSVVQKLEGKEFQTEDDPTEFWRRTDAYEDAGWSAFYPARVPDEVYKFLDTLPELCPTRIRNGEPCESDCDNLNRKPILKGKYMRFQIARLTR